MRNGGRVRGLLVIVQLVRLLRQVVLRVVVRLFLAHDREFLLFLGWGRRLFFLRLRPARMEERIGRLPLLIRCQRLPNRQGGFLHDGGLRFRDFLLFCQLRCGLLHLWERRGV